VLGERIRRESTGEISHGNNGCRLLWKLGFVFNISYEGMDKALIGLTYNIAGENQPCRIPVRLRCFDLFIIPSKNK